MACDLEHAAAALRWKRIGWTLVIAFVVAFILGYEGDEAKLRARRIGQVER